MAEYSHHVSGFFASRADVERAMAALVKQGLPRERLHAFEAGMLPPESAPKEDSNAVLKDVLVESAKGTAIGTGLGALAQVALVAGNVTLFIASPLIAPLAMMGWGASIGALVGGAVGAVVHSRPDQEKKEGLLSELVRDAIANGQFVLVADARTEQEAQIAREVMRDEVGDFKEEGSV